MSYPLVPVEAKTARQVLYSLIGKCIFVKILEDEKLSRTIPSTLLQIVCEVDLNSKVINKSYENPDGNFKSNS